MVKVLINQDIVCPCENVCDVGEANPDQIGKTTLDPNNRLLIRLTMKDCKKAIKTFYKLQGNRTKDKEARKKMMNEYKIDPEDLDN